MFGQTDPAKIRLISIFNKYEALCNRDSVRLARLFIQQKEVWRLFVDGRRQHKTWIRFEEGEPGYLSGLYAAFPFIFSAEDLNVEFIMNLHKIALTNVQGTNYADNSSAIGFVRSANKQNAVYGISTKNVSSNGLEEYLAHCDKSQQAISIGIRARIEGKNELIGFVLEVRSVDALRKSSEELSGAENPIAYIFETIGYTLESTTFKLFNELSELKRSHFILFIVKLSQTNSDKELVNCVMNALQDDEIDLQFYLSSKQSGNTSEKLINALNVFIANLNIDILHAKNSLEKLKAIIRFVQYCEQLHPFQDGNCRVFCMLLLNHLLIKNGFPMAILDDPNRFDGFSVEELINEVMVGMENTFELFETNALYKISTPDILTMLKKMNNVGLLEYIEGITDTLINDNILMKTPNSQYTG